MFHHLFWQNRWPFQTPLRSLAFRSSRQQYHCYARPNQFGYLQPLKRSLFHFYLTVEEPLLSYQLMKELLPFGQSLCVVRRFDHQNSHRRFLPYFCAKHYVRHMQQGLHVLFQMLLQAPLISPLFSHVPALFLFWTCHYRVL